MRKQDDIDFEEIPGELEDQDTVPVSYDIVTYPADYTLEVLVSKIDRTVVVPGFQRKYVWTIKQASRLIESFLLGLPVPAIFLYADPESNTYLVVDGQQRLKSIAYFYQGYFPEPSGSSRQVVFRLQGLNEKSPYHHLTLEDIKSKDEAAFNRLNESVLRAFIIKQLRPEGSSSIYHVFERLNTGGTQLVGQEIRNCIYHGRLNEMLKRANCSTKEWRDIFGKPREDKRLRDVELILRFLALYDPPRDYSKPMKDFLSDFMLRHRNDSHKLTSYEKIFRETTRAIWKHLGTRPFHIHAGLNVAVFDGVYVAFARNLHNIPEDVAERYKALLAKRRFEKLVSGSTTDEDVVRQRLALGEKSLFG